ncbi:MAG: hypothetical protein K6G64_07530 [Eubacterium sp.]|nr:hypothetical protein [Eubacterium sp.]
MENKNKLIYVIVPILTFVIVFSKHYIRNSNKEMESLQNAQQEAREARSKAEEAMKRGRDIINGQTDQEQSENGIVEGNTYSNSYFGFVLTLPEGYELESNSDSEIVATNSTDKTFIKLSIDSVSEGVTSEQAIEAYKKVIEESLKGSIDSVVVDYKISKVKTCTLANEEYVYFDYEQVYSDGDKNLFRSMMRCKDAKVIGITFNGDENQMKQMMEYFSAE